MNEDHEKGNDSAAIIYGEHYDMLADDIQHELDIYELVDRENPINNSQIATMIVSHIFEGYQEILDMIGPEFINFDDDDERRLKNEIRQTFINWEVFA